MNQKAKDIMIPQKRVKSVGPRKKIAAAKLLMSRNNVGGLPVVDRTKKVVGFITLRDIHIPPVSGNMEVRELMKKDVLTKEPETPISKLTQLMLETGIQRIPIVDDKDHLKGLITQTSVIKAFHNIL